MGTMMQTISNDRTMYRKGDSTTLVSGYFTIDNNLLVPFSNSLENKQKDNNLFRNNLFVTSPIQEFRGFGVFSPFITNTYKEGTPADKVDFRILQNYVDVVKNIMGYDMFSNWVYLQKNALYLSNTGVLFLEDCIAYLETGKRMYEPKTMLTMIEATDGVKPKIKEIEDMYYRVKNIEKKIEAKSLTDLLIYWMTKPNGIEDFMTSMFIIFGDVKDLEVV